jgi:uncharacterized membrane protein
MKHNPSWMDRIQSQILLLRRSTDARFLQAQENSVQYTSDSIEPILLPFPRVLLGTSGGLLALYGARQANLSGLFLFCLGMGAVVRSVTNLETVQLVGLALHPTFEIRRAIEIDAPIERVFQFLRNSSNYSKFMSFVRNVELTEGQKLKWTALGPSGIRIQWETWVHALLPNRIISWRSVPRSLIMHAGTFSFMSMNQNKTKVEVVMGYAPPAGALGFEILKVLGFDPREHIDADLVKLKGLVEADYRQMISNQNS